MSNQLPALTRLTAIPQVVAGTVPAGEKYVIAARRLSAVAADRFLQADDKLVERPRVELLVKVTDPGSHTTFVATLEGSLDGTVWTALQFDLNPGGTSITIDENGVGFSSAVGQAGVVLGAEKRFPMYRVGLGGDNVAGDGAATVGAILSRTH